MAETKTKKQYIIVTGQIGKNVEAKVNKKIKEGYKPLGKLEFIGGCFYQAMFLER